MIERGGAVALRVVDAAVGDPVLAALRIHVDAIHHTDALDQLMSVAAV